MNDSQRKVLEMLEQGKISQEQANQLLSALEPEEPEDFTPTITISDAEGVATIYPDGTIQVDNEGKDASINAQNLPITLTLHDDHAEVTVDPQDPQTSEVHVNLPADGDHAKVTVVSQDSPMGEIHVNLPAGGKPVTVSLPAPPAPPAPPTPPTPPTAPTPPTPPAPPASPTPPAPPAPPRPVTSGDPEDMDRYVRESQEISQRYCEAMEAYQQQVEAQQEEYERAMEDYQSQVEAQQEEYEQALENYQAEWEARQEEYEAEVEARQEEYERALEEYQEKIEARQEEYAQVIEDRPTPGSGYWPLTDDEYNNAYNQAYNDAYNPAYNQLYEKFGPGADGFREKVQEIAEEARKAALNAVEQARTEKARRIGAQAGPAPAAPNTSAGGWRGWLSSISDEISRAMAEISGELGRDLNDAMDDISETVGDLRESLQDMVETWQEEKEEEEEDEDFPDFGSGFPFDDDREDEDGENSEDSEDGEGESAQASVIGYGDMEYESGEFVNRCWAGLSSLEKLNIKWFNGTVQVVPWEGDHVEVTEYCKRSLSSEQKMQLYVKDAEQLSIWEYPQQNNSGGVFGRGWNTFGKPSKRLLVRVPMNLCGKIEKLKIENVSGTVTVSDLSGENFEIATMSGTAVATNLNAEVLDVSSVSGTVNVRTCSAEKLRLHSVSGTVTSQSVAAEVADFSTVSGSLKAHGNAEVFKVSTTSGSADLTVDQCPEKAKLSSVSGSLRLRLPANAGFVADYSSTSGGFHTDFPAEIRADKKKKHRGRAVCGRGECKIEMHTTSGGMKVLKREN